MIVTVIVFLVLLSVLVLIHEFGHFIVGKIAGIGVLEFALGLPFTKPVWQKKLKDGMLVSLYPLLFGGFVKLLGEDGDDPTALTVTGRGMSKSKMDNNEKERTKKIKGIYFYKANVWARIAVVVAGVVMNLVLAIGTFYLFLNLVNFKVLVPKLADYDFLSPSKTLISVTFVADQSPAMLAKLEPGQIIISTDNRDFSKLSEFQDYVKSRAGNPVLLTVSDLSLENEHEIFVMPRKNPPAGQGPLGLGIGEVKMLNYPSAADKQKAGILYGYDMLGYNFAVLGNFISKAVKTGDVEPLKESVSGPVGIAGAVGMILDLGGRQAVTQMLNLLGLLSLSLAFMNILPFPALDGGRLAFLLVEALTGRKIPSKWENLVNQVGMIVLLGMIVIISFNDIAKLVMPLFGK